MFGWVTPPYMNTANLTIVLLGTQLLLSSQKFKTPLEFPSVDNPQANTESTFRLFKTHHLHSQHQPSFALGDTRFTLVGDSFLLSLATAHVSETKNRKKLATAKQYLGLKLGKKKNHGRMVSKVGHDCTLELRFSGLKKISMAD